MLRIERLLDRRPSELSGGERQRVAMGRAIVRKPRVFLFDEPLSNLDASLRGDIRLEIGQLVRRLGVTAIYVTHDHVEAMTLADRIAVMRGGRLVQLGTPREIYDRPSTSFVATFLGSPRMNLLPARAEDDCVRAGPFRVPRPEGPLPARLEVGVRPEHVALGPGGAPGQVVAVEPLGAETHLLLKVGGMDLRAIARGFDLHGRGDSVLVAIESCPRARLRRRRGRRPGGLMVSRRDVLRAAAALGMAGCARPRPLMEGGRVVVTFWYAYGDLVRKVLLGMVARFNASQSRVLVKPIHQGDYYEALAKLRTALAAGAAPALAHVVLEVVPYLARAGVLEPLDGYEGASDLSFVPALGQRGSFVGAEREPLVAIPFNRSTPIAFANALALEEARVAMPHTWEELATAARRLTQRPSGGDVRWGFEVPISWWYWVAMVGQAGGALVDDGGRITLGGDAGEEVVRFWQKLVHHDRVMRPPPGRDYQAWQSQNESFLQGRVAMMWSSTAYVRYLEDNARFPVVTAPLPRGVRASVPTGGTMFVLPRAAPDQEKRAAWEFVRWMCAPEQTIDWSTRTGYMPVTTTAATRLEESGWYARHPNDRVAYDQLADAAPWPWLPELFRIDRDVVEPRLEDAVLSSRDAHATMQEAREEAAEPT